MIVTSFYRYVPIDSPARWRDAHQALCEQLGLKGKVLVASEGINGSVSANAAQLRHYKQLLRQQFKGMAFKDTAAPAHPFRRMVVRVRPEIVSFGRQVDLSKAARHIAPKTLRKWLQTKKDVVLVDARNAYESRIGRFVGAFAPDIETFRQFPQVVPSALAEHKDKTIVTYCTGGIRCEKASAFLKEQGFHSVYQLKDGILNYIRQYPDDYFEGRCFVFDDRLSVPSGVASKKLTACEACHVACDSYVNCANLKCDKMFICCDSCKSALQGACSKRCKNLSIASSGARQRVPQGL